MRKEWLFLIPAVLITIALSAIVYSLVIWHGESPEPFGEIALSSGVSAIVTFVGIDVICKTYDASIVDKTTGISINRETKIEETK